MERILKRIDEARERLNLCACNISDAILKEIIGKVFAKEGLRELCLDGNQITDITPLVEGLRYNTFLEVLYLDSNRIGDISPLAEILRCNTSLRVLYLHSNRIGDISPLAEGLRSNTSLEELYLDNNRHINSNKSNLLLYSVS